MVSVFVNNLRFFMEEGELKVFKWALALTFLTTSPKGIDLFPLSPSFDKARKQKLCVIISILSGLELL